MAWDYEMAKKLRELAKPGENVSLLEGDVVRVAPLTISLYGGEVMAPPMRLKVAAAAPGYELVNHQLSLHQWRVGEKVVCAAIGKMLVVLGRLT